MQLIECLSKLEHPDFKRDAKMELLSIAGNLAPAGKPDFLNVIRYPTLQGLIERNGRKTMLKVVFMLVKDFCASVNVVRNMNEDQMIEAAAMLIDECDNFRLEDYVMMFSLAKRGELVKLFDHIDLSIISQILDEYWSRRQRAALHMQDQECHRLDYQGPAIRMIDTVNPQDAQLSKAAEKLAGVMGDLKTKFQEWREQNA